MSGERTMSITKKAFYAAVVTGVAAGAVTGAALGIYGTKTAMDYMDVQSNLARYAAYIPAGSVGAVVNTLLNLATASLLERMIFREPKIADEYRK